jgi:hypothetical protein
MQKIDELFKAAAHASEDGLPVAQGTGGQLHAYVTRRNREMPAEAGGDPFQLLRRLDFIGTYKFLLVSDGDVQDDFLSPEWSQAFLAGTVPIYAGAANAHEFAPGPRSFLLLDDFSTGEELWNYINTFAGSSSAVELAYARFFDWKSGANRAAAEDEPMPGTGHAHDGAAQLGTGEGVRSAQDPTVVERAVLRWSRPPVPSDVERVNELLMEGAGEGFGMDAEVVWRAFRRHLDHCVHYAECRVCRLVHDMT